MRCRNYVYVRALQKYLQLYFDLVGRESLATEIVPAPTPEIEVRRRRSRSRDAVVDVPPRRRRKRRSSPRWPIPDSLEAKVAEQAPEALPKWRIEQEQKRAEQDAQKAPHDEYRRRRPGDLRSQLATSDASALGDRAERARDAWKMRSGAALTRDAAEAARAGYERTPTAATAGRRAKRRVAVKLDASDAHARRGARRVEAGGGRNVRAETEADHASALVVAERRSARAAADDPLKQASG